MIVFKTNRWSDVLYPDRKPICSTFIVLFLSKYFVNLVIIIFGKSLDCVTVIPL